MFITAILSAAQHYNCTIASSIVFSIDTGTKSIESENALLYLLALSTTTYAGTLIVTFRYVNACCTTNRKSFDHS